MCDIPTDVSRRRLVRLASLVTGALAVTGVSTLFANEQDPVRRETADLITETLIANVSASSTGSELVARRDISVTTG